ncbi:hypothetical protein C2E23DRAFT_854838 [Lenzites betulinus]|nr:hypothetical protein C2E23DRAFT_854838 [Lenzites betulinus]
MSGSEDPPHRPVTSKPRGICKYYKTDRGCYAGDRCKFLHGQSELLTPYDRSKVCRFYGQGYCRRGEKCWFLHVDPHKTESTSEPGEDADEHLCSICYDKPTTYGLLAGCSHVFCISCIKNWRGTDGKSDDIIQAGTTKTCPMCRTSSRFVTPSAFYYAEEHPMKAQVIDKYKASMARVTCKYFKKSRPQNPFCPFGKECFYKHENADGTPYVFEHGAAYYMERARARPSRGRLNDVWSVDVEEHVEFMLNTISQVFGTSREMVRRMLVNVALANGELQQRAILESVAAEFGVDTLPPMYRLENAEEADEENGDDEALPESPSGDEERLDAEEPSSTSAAGQDVARSSTAQSPSSEEGLEGADVEAISPLMENIDATQPPMVTSNLDPTIPEFIPSFQRTLPRPDSGAVYELDWLRPLQPGPDSSVESRQDTEAEWQSSSSTTIEDILRQFASRPEESGPSVDVPSLLLNHPSPESSTQSAPLVGEVPPDAQPTISEAALVQDSDPPFMTDGRGRVVWSSTTSSRTRDGRRGRAASSASLLSHNKSGPDAVATDDGCSVASRHGSPAQCTLGLPPRLVRQRSLPSVGASSGVEETRPAEFITDGRGRVVFAASSNDSGH